MSLDDFKWKHLFICIALVISGIFATIGTIGILNAKSYNIGNPFTNSFVYSMEHFSCETLVVVLHPTDKPNIYEYSKTELRIDDFDGTKYKYEFFINDHLGYGTEIGAGYINTNFRVDFYNVSGQIEYSSNLLINIKFLSNGTVIKLTCADGVVAVGYWQRYFADYGFRLRAETKII